MTFEEAYEKLLKTNPGFMDAGTEISGHQLYKTAKLFYRVGRESVPKPPKMDLPDGFQEILGQFGR